MPAPLVRLDLINRLIFGNEYRLFSCSLCIFSTPLSLRPSWDQIFSLAPYSQELSAKDYLMEVIIRSVDPSITAWLLLKNYFEYIIIRFNVFSRSNHENQFQKTQSITQTPDLDISVSRSNCKIFKYFDAFAKTI
jgi:hypothetical protein